MVNNEPSFDWLSSESRLGLASSCCITIATGVSIEVVLQAFGAISEVAQPTTGAGSRQQPVAGVVALAGDAILVAEPNGFQGARLEVLRRVSRNGLAAALQWDVKGSVTVAAARRAAIGFAGDLLLDAEISGIPKSLGRILPTDRTTADLVAVGAQIITKFTKATFGEGEIAAIRSFYALSPVLDELSMAPPRYRAFRYDVPLLCDLLESADRSMQYAAAEWAARQTVNLAGIATDARVKSALAHLKADEPVQTAVRAQLTEIAQEAGQTLAMAEFHDPFRRPDQPARGIRYQLAWQRKAAIDAIRYCGLADSAVAAAGAIEAAIGCASFYNADGDLVSALLDSLMGSVPAWNMSLWVPPVPMSDDQIAAAVEAEHSTVAEQSSAEHL